MLAQHKAEISCQVKARRNTRTNVRKRVCTCCRMYGDARRGAAGPPGSFNRPLIICLKEDWQKKSESNIESVL